jgi:hypothetical protein
VALVENAVLGGAASVAGGGKFANGAITGAFGYMFNACGADPHGCLKAGFAIGVTSGLYSGGIISGGSLGVLAPIGLGVAGLDVLIGTALGEIGDIVGNVYNNTRSWDLPAQGQAPNGTQVKDDGNGNGQIRDYDSDGKAVKDYDFGHDHTGAGDPHVHDWDWSVVPPRQGPRPLGPND